MGPRDPTQVVSSGNTLLLPGKTFLEVKDLSPGGHWGPPLCPQPPLKSLLSLTQDPGDPDRNPVSDSGSGRGNPETSVVSMT